MLDKEYFPDGTALVIGGTGGIGKAVSLLLAEYGSNVAFTYRSNKARADELTDSIESMGRKAFSVQMEITKPESVEQCVKEVKDRFGNIHTVIYSSGPDIPLCYVNEIDHKLWREVIDSDLNGFFNVVHATLPVLRSQGSGSYVSVVTTAVDRYPVRDPLSAVPKAAVEMLTKAIAKEEGRYGIRANCVGSGLIDAGLGTRMMEQQFNSKAIERMKQDTPLKRLGTPEEVAEAVVFFASSRARYITGQTIAVDGGWQV